MQTPNPDIPQIQITPETAVQLSFKPGRPAVLFPVRLETRFFPLPDGNSELRVRVYPDKVHLDSHEPKLTPDEVTWGQHFWEQTWRAAGDPEREKAAWRQLADRYDPPRAAWIARALQPLNPDDRPDGPIAPDANLTKPIRFPKPETQPESWMRAPIARVLPNFWTLLGYKDNRLVVNVKSNLIRDSLAAGPDPSPSAVVDEVGIDKGMKWMVDFDEAEAAGMGIRVKLAKEVAAAGFDFLLVMGIKDSAGDTTDWTPRLVDIFNAHHYTSGLSFLRPGTPTNNTAAAPSGFSSEDPGHEASYQAERVGTTFQAGDRSNADVLTTALGLTKNPNVFAQLPNATAKDQLDAAHMNTALWQGTWGYFLLQMLGVGQPNESPVSDDDIAWARRHFINYVRATGPLPAIRVGKQPYGVLPVISLSEWKLGAGQDKRETTLRDFLINLRKTWRRSFPDVPRLGRSADTPQKSGIDKDIAEVLSMDGLTPSFGTRQLIGRHYLEHLWVFLSADSFVDAWNLPEIEPFEPEELPEIDLEFDPELRPAQQAQLRQRQLAARNRIIAANKAREAAFQRAAATRNALLNSKRDAITAWWTTQDRLATTILQTLPVTWRPRLSHGVFSPPGMILNGPLVQADQSPILSPNYIDLLLTARDITKDIRFRNLSVEQPPPHTLLHLLLRHSMLLEYTTAASRLLVKRGLVPPALQSNPQLLRRELELIDLPVGPAMPHAIWRQMITKLTVAGEAQPIELGKYLLGFLPSGEPDTAREPDLKQISEFRASLAYLKSLRVDSLETAMKGTLDLCAHRLDAWITSFATKRLEEIRKSNPNDVLFGGYGWVMNLKPAEPETKVAPPPGEQEPVFQPANHPGYIHTPSLTQASTAAILRSAHLAHAGAANSKPNDLLAIDLSSERVRLAAWLLDGVRQGQPLGALLGYRFERRLQEATAPRLAEFIAPFRELAPLVARKLEPQPDPSAPVEAIAANNVVDGLALLRRWQKGKSTTPQQWTGETIPFGQSVSPQKAKLPPADPNNAQFKGLQTEFGLLEQAVDAVSDALLAEAVYQAARGNPLRAANTVESIAGGEAPPPELEVVRTPRTGIALTYRLMTLFGGDPTLAPGWATPANSVRASAEPHLNAWAGKLLGNPTRVRCVVERFDSATGAAIESKELRLDQLGLAPLDFIYAVEGGQAGQQAEIEQRILYTMVRSADGFAPDSLLRVSPARRSDWQTSELGYGEFSELLRAARKLITGARAVEDGDLNPPEREGTFNVDVPNLEQRAAAAKQSFTALATDFENEFAAVETVSLEKLRELSLRSAAFGVAGAVPLSPAGDAAADREILTVQAASIRKELTQRTAQLDQLINTVTTTSEQKRDQALSLLRIIFGKAFVVLPRFVATNAAELKQALGNSTKLQDNDPLASTTWFQRVARVRDGANRLNAALSYAEAVDSGERLKLTVAQLPHDAKDRWVGLPFKAGQPLPAGKLSLVVQSAAAINPQQPVAGLLIDEWVEVVPSTKEITGIALQYDQPNAAPPQTILIAVPPELETPWTIWSLQQVLLETLDLARIRGVDTDALHEVGHYLPAMYFAYNSNNDTVSTDFSTIK
ncbi:MAG TPA: hypothetical protein VFI24_16175 [Pyrinomonadaceae bacterium]|nr:hypothetical protein [Pyrinomonadaceae bacterium]